jgi:predicted permease
LALIVILTLTLGIGANTAIFSIVNPFLLRPLPFHEPSHLVHIFGTDRTHEGFGWDMARFSEADFAEMKREAQGFDALGAYVYGGANMTGGDEPVLTTVGYVTDDMFELLGVSAALGRGIMSGDADPSREPVVVLSNGLWRRSFGADPAIVGKTISMEQTMYTVAGVMPPTFTFPFGGVQLWTPMEVDPTARDRGRGLLVVGRLKSGVHMNTAQTELATIAQRLETAFPDTNRGRGVNVVSLRKGLVFFFDMVRLGLAVLALAVGLVLLIACVNIANMMLARGTNRAREIAVRSALGATRMRLVRQFLTENGLMALAAGALGTLLAVYGVQPIRGVIPDDLWRSGAIGVDGAALVFAVGVSVATIFLFGLVPALRATRTDLAGELKSGGRTATGSGQRQRLSNVLVVTQLAGALVLLSGASLLIKSVRSMQAMDMGFDPGPVISASILPSRATYTDATSLRTFYRELTQSLVVTPGVSAAAAVYPLPLDFQTMSRSFSIGGRDRTESDEPLSASAHWVTPDYFTVMQTQLLRGRGFSPQDDESSTPVVIINATMAERFWPGGDPVGQTITLESDDPKIATVVGVVEDVVGGGLYEARGPQVYASIYQEPRRSTFVTVRGTGDAAQLATALRRGIWSVDDGMPISGVRTMTQVVDDTVGPFRGMAGLLGVLATGALILAVGGIYGVVSYSVSRRVHEFGVRTALGASRGDVLQLVLRQGATLAAIGVGIGIVVSYGASRAISGLVFGLGSADPLTLVGLPIMLAVVAMIATYVPARRAVRVEPIQALRYE